MSADRVVITVNGRELSAAPRTLLLHVLREHGIEVPTLCHDDRLTPYGGCRLCVVARRDGRGGLIPACSTPVERGMVIETEAPEVVAARRRQLQLLVMNHRMECPVCERRGDCDFQDLLYRVGTPEDSLPFERRAVPRDEGSPLIVRDPEKCVVCGKCVRICDEVQGVAEIGIVNRGLAAHVTTIHGAPLDCEFCGQCVEACPVGALIARPHDATVPVWMRTVTLTTCTLCSAGCRLRVESHDGSLLRVASANHDGSDHGKLCVKGRFGWDLLGHSDRLAQPLVRRDGELRPASWDEALDAVVAGLGAARERSRAVVGLGSPRLSNEAARGFEDLLRRVVATPHLSCGPAAGVEALVDGVMAVFGSPRSTATFADLIEAQTVLVVRGDPSRTHPLAKTQVVQGVNQRGHRLVMAHATTGGLERHARPFLAVRPGSEDQLLLGLANLAVEAQAPGLARLAKLPGYAAWRQTLAAYTPAAVAEATGVTEAALRDVAAALLASPSLVGVVVTAEGLSGDEAAAARAMAYLLLVLDRVEGSGSGLLVLGEKGNVQGAVEAGLHPALEPGWRPAAVAGWPAREALSRAAAGEVGALWIAGHDPLGAWPRAWRAHEAIAAADFVVVQDAFLTETARHADVVLPVAVFLEREGTTLAADGTPRRLERALPAPAGAAQDDDVFAEVARRLGATPVAGSAAGPEPAGAGPALAELPPPRSNPAVQGLTLDLSAQLFHSGSTTLRSRTLTHLAPPGALLVSRQDARRAGVATGEPLKLLTGKGDAMVRARVAKTVRPGVVVLSRHNLCGTTALLDGDTAVTGAEIRRPS